MPKLSYNTDFVDIIEPVFSGIRIMVREKFNFSSIMNGYTEGKNNEYFNGFTPAIKAYPLMFRIAIERMIGFLKHGKEEILKIQMIGTHLKLVVVELYSIKLLHLKLK